MIRRKLTTLSVPIALLMTGGAAQAATWNAGDWDITMGGNINTFFVSTSCSAGDLNSGALTMASLACFGAVDESGAPSDAQSVQNGLLPAALNFNAKTMQDGWNLGATINVYYGITTEADNSPTTQEADALSFSSVDARQVFMTFGKEGGGEFKFGRDFGLFGFDPIIADMSLIGVGANFVASNPGHTSLGGLGYGYVYVDRLSQMNYTTADMNGFKATVGIFQPFDGNGATSSGDLGIHAKGSYSRNNYTISATFLTQGVNTIVGTSEDITGLDVFFKIDIGDIGLAAYFYQAEGMSSLAIGGLVLPGFQYDVDANGNPTGTGTGIPEETTGNMLQATYKTSPKLKLGINLSHSEQDKVTLVENDRLTLGAYYNLTKSLILMAEFSSMESDLTGAGKDESSNINLGAFLGF